MSFRSLTLPGGRYFGVAAVLLLPGFALADLDFTIQGRPYRLVTTERNFANAEADAISKGGHLVHIESQEENDAIFNAISAAVPSGSTASDGGGSVYVWIGGTETAEGTYAWMDTPATPFWTGGKTGTVSAGAYANWGSGVLNTSGPEPDNSGNLQNRAAMGITAWPSSGSTKIGQPRQWNDIRDTNTLVYVIEFDGMWATFNMSHGGVAKPPFTAKLRYDKAPVTVANFVGLAEGTQPFIDEKKGVVVTRPYYDGLTCHRIIDGFMIQGGCPRGNGTSGPGYKFPDEFDTALRHNVAGILSMANSGLDTNGSQFFITVAPTTHLNDKHSVFGEVVDGYATGVEPLSNVPTNVSDKPIQDVVIESVKIHRAGVPARTLTSPLPSLEMVPVTASGDSIGRCIIDFARNPFAGYDLLRTGDLNVWAMNELRSFGEVPDTAPLDGRQFAPLGAAKQFFRLARVNYTSTAPPSLVGKKVVVEDAFYRLTYNLTTATTGTFSFVMLSNSSMVSGNITSWTWHRDAWGGELSATIPAGALTLSIYQVTYLDATIRPVTKVARGTLFVDAGHTQAFNDVLRAARSTITDLP